MTTTIPVPSTWRDGSGGIREVTGIVGQQVRFKRRNSDGVESPHLWHQQRDKFMDQVKERLDKDGGQ